MDNCLHLLFVSILLGGIVVPLEDTQVKQSRALKTFETAGGVTEWVSKEEQHLMIRRFNVQERRISLSKLAILPQVKKLTLHGYDFDDNDLKNLAQWKHLEGLQLINNHEVTDAGLKSLGSMSKLNWLVIWNTKVTDGGMNTIAALPALEHLDIQNGKISDVGLLSLRKSRKLKVVNMAGTQVTKSGEDQFKRALPNCELDVWDGHD